MKLTKQWFTFIVAILVLAACASRAPQGIELFDAGAPEEAPMEAGETTTSQGSRALENAVQEQLIIRTGNLDIIVESTEAAIDEITRRTDAAGGWIVNSNTFQRGGAKSGNMTIRVPVAEFQPMMDQIESMAVEVVRSSTSGEDVTEEYVDRRARLQNLEATAARVRGFLEDADNVEEALAVNAELSRLESEIEAMRGRIQYLEQSAAFSTINVNITPDALAQPIEIGGWRATGVFREAFQALISALQGLATITIWILVVPLPLALIVLLPLVIIYVFVRRRRRNRTEADETTPDDGS
ncbi:MAG TPA: DUF4349 domain-containing protein [Candidatus Sulfomarinibacteraceae bacterium]|nr:DUF4349 domain-containing protein [Candidatus Sulfomarinibacteraceae bacterium]